MRSLILALCIVLPVTAFARSGVGVVVVGEPRMQPRVVAQLEGWLGENGYELVPAALPPDAISTLVDCFVIEDETCARKVVEKWAKAESVVFARVQLAPDKTDGTVSLTAYWFTKGKDATAERRFCERCTDLRLRAVAEELIGALATNRQGGSGRLQLTSTPAGARVLVDGLQVGVTPLSYDLAVGNHVVAVVQDGYAVETREVGISRGETAKLDVPLTRTASAPSRAIPIAVTISGVALLATGGVLIAIDEDDTSTRTEDRYYNDTRRSSVAFVVAGAVTTGVGLYLWRRASKRTSAPIARVDSRGALLGWAGSF